MLSRLGSRRNRLVVSGAVLVAALCLLAIVRSGGDQDREVVGEGAEVEVEIEGDASLITPAPAEAATPAVSAGAEAVVRSWGRIVIDAGHGGEDTGAAGVSGALEKEVTLGVARGCARELRKLGFEVIETRVSDQAVRLERRSATANAQGAGLFVSIHANSAPRGTISGVETYYMDLSSDEAASRLAERENRARSVAGDPSSDAVETMVADLRMGAFAKQSRALAAQVHRQLVSGLREFYGGERIRDRGLRTAPFWVLLDSQMPAVLVELGYLTNASEERRMRTHGFQRLAARAIATAIAEFVEQVESTEPSAARATVSAEQSP